jgi:hypothetical protein
MRYFVTFVSAIAICLGAQWLALRHSGGRFTKNESNFFSSIGRIQAGTKDGVKVAFLGSSLTGRLPDRSHGFKGVANMGCDGGSAIDALRAMDEGILPAAPLVVVEVNTMIRAVDAEPSQIARAIERPWFQAGMKVPLLSAYARPSGYFYSILLAGKIGSFNTGDSPDLRVSSRPAAVAEPARDWDDGKEALIAEVAEISHRLQQRGTNILFIWLPPGRAPGEAPPSWHVALAARSSALWWDVGQDADRSLIELTDGAHMAAHSAARTVRTVLQGTTEIPTSETRSSTSEK